LRVQRIARIIASCVPTHSSTESAPIPVAPLVDVADHSLRNDEANGAGYPLDEAQDHQDRHRGSEGTEEGGEAVSHQGVDQGPAPAQ